MDSERLRVLVIEDDELLASSLVESLGDWGFVVEHAKTVESAYSMLEQGYALMLLDLTLPDGSGLEIAGTLSLRRTRPLMVAVTGTATVEEAFRLAQLGVRAYLPKPIKLADLRETLRVLLTDSAKQADVLDSIARAEVGTASYHDVTDRVRRAMVEQALNLAGGSKTGAARILKLSRQAVQQLIRSLELPEGE